MEFAKSKKLSTKDEAARLDQAIVDYPGDDDIYDDLVEKRDVAYKKLEMARRVCNDIKLCVASYTVLECEESDTMKFGKK